MADALGGILDVAGKAAHGFAMMGSPGYRAGQTAQSQIGYYKSLGESRDINTILSKIRMAGGLETEAGLRIAQTELMDNPDLRRLLESVNPYQGFTKEQEMKAKFYEKGVTSRPGATPWEAGGLSPEEQRKYAAALRRGKLESFKPAWEREFPEQPTGGALGGITPPSAMPPPTETIPPEQLPPTRPAPRELSPELQTLTEEWLKPEQIEPVIINKILKPTGKKAHEFTMTEMNNIVKKATNKGIRREDFYKQLQKLKIIWPELTREEELSALNKLADGFTADEIIAHFRGK